MAAREPHRAVRDVGEHVSCLQTVASDHRVTRQFCDYIHLVDIELRVLHSQHVGARGVQHGLEIIYLSKSVTLPEPCSIK